MALTSHVHDISESHIFLSFIYLLYKSSIRKAARAGLSISVVLSYSWISLGSKQAVVGGFFSCPLFSSSSTVFLRGLRGQMTQSPICRACRARVPTWEASPPRAPGVPLLSRVPACLNHEALCACSHGLITGAPECSIRTCVIAHQGANCIVLSGSRSPTA